MKQGKIKKSGGPQCSFSVVLLSPSLLAGGAVQGDAAVPSLPLLLLGGGALQLAPFWVVLLGLLLLSLVLLSTSPLLRGDAVFLLTGEVVPFPFFLKEMKAMQMSVTKLN